MTQKLWYTHKSLAGTSTMLMAFIRKNEDFDIFWWFVDGDGCIHFLKLTVCHWKMVLGRQAFRAQVLPMFLEYLVIDLVERIRISILRSVRCCYYSFCSRNIKKYNIIYPCDCNLVTQTSWNFLVKHLQRDAERTFPLQNHGNGNWLVKDTIVLEGQMFTNSL